MIERCQDTAYNLRSYIPAQCSPISENPTLSLKVPRLSSLAVLINSSIRTNTKYWLNNTDKGQWRTQEFFSGGFNKFS